MKRIQPLGLCALALFIACSTPSSKAPLKQVTSNLTKEEAFERSSRVSDVDYEMSFVFNKGQTDYQGETKIYFNLKDKQKDLRVDFTGGTVSSVVINEKESSAQYDQKKIMLPASDLKVGKNIVHVKFKHPFSKNGSSLYRFVDPSDQRVYIYSDFEPFNANHLFPCFDQPDLKATYSLQVEAPDSWQVITSVAESDVSLPKNGKKLWVFPKSKRYSTYIFPLHAGEYHMWKDQFGDVPLRLFVSQSRAQYVDVQEWFKITKQGFKYFEEYFDYKYPFQKYDQVLVPDFNFGGMENVAAVTFNDERYAPRGKMTRAQKEKRADVILHELAHMWFGNLVTMKWWDDLWLNESFASYMATKALTEATEYKDSWLAFFFRSEKLAYYLDESVASHPVTFDVKNTDQAFANFDKITYGKGASSLKQLAYFADPDKFKEGLQNYFKKHAYQNTELKDFTGAISKAAQIDLGDWTQNWLQVKGFNTVKPVYQCEAGKIKSFALQQGHSDNQSLLRSHRTLVGLFVVNEQKVQLQKSVPVKYSGKETGVDSLVGENCPDMVFANYQDHDYSRVLLDDRSFETAQNNLSNVSDPLFRAMLWNSFWERLREGELSPQGYMDIVAKHLPKEDNFHISYNVARNVYGATPYGLSLLAYLSSDKNQRTEQVAQLENLFWGLYENAEPQGDFKKLWFDSYVKIAESQKAQDLLLAIAKGQTPLKGVELDQDRRWSLIRQLSQVDAKGAQELIELELKKDGTNVGQKMALSAKAAQPSIKNKMEWLNKITDLDSKMSLSQMQAVMNGFSPASQLETRPQYSDLFYSKLVELSKKKEGYFLEDFAETLVPAACTEDSNAKLKSFIEGHSDLPPIVLKALKTSWQEDVRCVKIRKGAQQAKNHVK